jgi:gamma-glutamyltranspeptidase/glutathione hydrolase
VSTRSEWRFTKTEAVAQQAMVTADHPLAVEAGLEILRAGGNAVDAAVAIGFALGVVAPFMSGVGGIAGMILYDARSRRVVAIDGSTTAPGAAREDMFELLPTPEPAGMYGWPATRDNAQNLGYLSLGVPGTVACLCRAHERYGRLDRARVMAPAIRLADEGLEVDWYVALAVACWADRLLPHEGSRAVFFHPDGRPRRAAIGTDPADRLTQRDLAQTLRAIAKDGADAFYRGALAAAIVSDVSRHGGVLTLEDFAMYRARELEPLRGRYRDVELATLPGAAGGITLIEALNILENFSLAGLEPGGPELIHLVAESSRRAFADRFAYLADPESVDVPLDALASKPYAAEVSRAIGLARADPDAAPGPAGKEAELAPSAVPEDEHTTHVCVIDAERNVVSLTSTLGQGFGSGVVPRETGVVLADVMTWFDPRPGRVNSIAPRKRVLWAGAPTILFREGVPFLAVGAPGGRKLITAVLQSIVNVVDFGMGPQEAVNALRVHAEGRPTIVDSRASPELREALSARGHVLETREESFSSSFFGIPSAILVDESGSLHGGVNRLKYALAAGL